MQLQYNSVKIPALTGRTACLCFICICFILLVPGYATIDTFTLSGRILDYDNTNSSGSDGYKIGKYLRNVSTTYVTETMLYADLSSISSSTTVNSAKVEVYVSDVTNGGGSGKTLNLYEQDDGAYSSSAEYSTYSIAAWSTTLDTYVSASSTGWKPFTSTSLDALVEDWIDGTKTNNGFIVDADFSYFSYYWDMNDARLIIDYTSSDTDPPGVSTLSPADGAGSAAISSDLVITFDEVVDAESGYIKLYVTTDDVLMESFDVTSDITGTGTTTITANPGADMLAGTDYYVKIDGSAFDDEASNSYAGISNTTDWNFTTTGTNSCPVAGSGNALDFDGSNEYVTCGTSATFNFSNSFTVECWVYPDDSDWGMYVGRTTDASGGKGWVFGQNSGNLIFTTRGIKDYTSTTSVSTLTWSHVAVVFDGSNDAKYYVNGEWKQTVTGSSACNTTTGIDLTIGQYSEEMAYFDGKIDEVRIWSDIRTEAELADNMYVALNGDEPNLVGYWRMDTTTGTNVTDYTSTGADGTCTNMENGDWVASDIWKNRTTQASADLVHSAGWEPDGNPVRMATTTAPSSGSLAYDSVDMEVTFTPGSAGTITYSYELFDGALRDTFDMSVEVVNRDPVAGSGNCLDFDGSNEYIDIVGYKGISGTNARTCEAWINVPSSHSSQTSIISWGLTGGTGTLWDFLVRGDGYLELHVNVGWIKGGTTTLNDDSWHHVAVTWENDGSPNVQDVDIYVDGELESTGGSASSTINTGSTYDVKIGNNNFW